MWNRIVLAAASAAALCIALGPGCGAGPCNGVKCPTGSSCSTRTGQCVIGGSGDGATANVDSGVATADTGAGPDAKDAGPRAQDAAAEDPDAAMPADAAAVCWPACTSVAPVCDPANSTCKVCTSTEGCAAPTPICDTAVAGGKGACVVCTETKGCESKPTTPVCNTAVVGGWCVQCVEDLQCAAQQICDRQHTCIPEPPDAAYVPPDAAAGPDAGDLDAGTDLDGSFHCIDHDAGSGSCAGGCHDGFHCVGGSCVLNGGSGEVQVTLRWDAPEDLDLHVAEPLPDGGVCQLYYGNPNTGGHARCGAQGSLDLDSNAGCAIDNVDIENIIYPPGPAPSGTYTVRVDYYARCRATGPVPYEVDVRANGVTNVYCGSFNPSDADNGGAKSGVVITTFTVP